MTAVAALAVGAIVGGVITQLGIRTGRRIERRYGKRRHYGVKLRVGSPAGTLVLVDCEALHWMAAMSGGTVDLLGGALCAGAPENLLLPLGIEITATAVGQAAVRRD
jgi:hypothetical protein